MKVLAVLVGAAARAGGVAAFVGESAVELDRLGVRTRILASDLALAPGAWWQRQQRIHRQAVHPALRDSDLHLFSARFPRRLAYSPALGRELRAAVREHDVVHVHNLWQYPQHAAYRAALAADVPYVVSPHGGLDPYLRERGRVRKRLSTLAWQGEMLDRARLIHVTTETERDHAADIARHVSRAVVPCGIHVQEFSSLPPRDRFRRTHLRGYDGELILFFGRVTQKKGLDVLIRAFSLLRRKRECRLAIVGPDDEMLVSSLRAMAARLGVGHEVDFVDAVYGEEKLAALAAADAWALPSHTENFGIAVVEALAAGCAVVVSPGVSLASEIATDGAGLVVPQGASEFAAGLHDILADEDRRAALRIAARRFASRYDWSAVGPQLVDMYEAALAP